MIGSASLQKRRQVIWTPLFVLMMACSCRNAVMRPSFFAVAFARTIGGSSWRSSHAPFVVGGLLQSRGGSSSSSSSSVPFPSSSTAAFASTASESSTTSTPAAVIPNEVELRELAKSMAGPHWVPNADFGSLHYLWTGPPPSGENPQNVIFVLGGPGAGKGTQSELLMKEYPCRHLSVGELLRAERETNPTSPNAKLIEDCLVQGTIVPVEVSLNLVQQAMATSGKCCYYLVDGFPRNFDNLQGWLTHMPPQHIYGRAALVYQCQNFDILKERILTRGETSGRSDDNLASLQKRLDTLTRDTVPVVNFLDECGNDENGKFYVCQIAAEGTIDEVWTQTQSHMNQIMRNDILTANARLMQAIESQNIPLYASLMDSNMFDDSDTTTTTSSDTDTDATAAASSRSVDLDAMKKMFDQHETDGAEDADGGLLPSIGVVTNAEFQLVTGTKANVSYDHTFSGTQVRETRVWSHFPERGWVCIHFFRTPLLP
eukprot:scaffold140685_cov49-Attheya_sp.AAC.1